MGVVGSRYARTIYTVVAGGDTTDMQYGEGQQREVEIMVRHRYADGEWSRRKDGRRGGRGHPRYFSRTEGVAEDS